MSKTISFKLSDEEIQKLQKLLPSLRAESIHTAARDLVTLSLLSISPSSSSLPAEGGNYKLLAIEADIHQVNRSLEQVIDLTERIALYISTTTELLLINVGDVSGEAASEAVRDLFNVAFEGGK